MANVTGWYAEVSTAVTAPRMAATALLKAPAVATVSPFVIAPPRMASTAALNTPSLVFSTTLTAPRMAATAGMAVPGVSNAVNASVAPPRMEAAAASAAPAVSVSYAVTAPRMAATATMPSPVVAATGGYVDNFNRSNSASLGASWNTNGVFGTSLAISSNAAVGTAGASNIYTLPMATGNNEITVVMKGTAGANDLVDLVARLSNGTNSGTSTTSVTAELAQGKPWKLYRSAGDSTAVASAGNVSWADADTITFSAVGGTLTLKKNGSTIVTTSGATDLAAGYVAILVYSATGTSYGFDSFQAQDI